MIRETETLIAAVKKMYPVALFFKNRYFPDGQAFYSEKALVEMKKGGRTIAPFAIPAAGGIALEKQGYRTEYLEGPYIAPKMLITAGDLAKKAFGESPESGRSPEQREEELESDVLDELRIAIFRRQEKMCVDIITNGEVLMEHYANTDDASKGINKKEMYFRYYEDKFDNKYTLSKKFSEMKAAEKIKELYKMASILISRGVRATDLVMTADVSMELMADSDFLEFFNKARVESGTINQELLPDGVACNGTINVNGLVLTMFTYAERYVDLDGKEREMLPSGTLAMLTPNMGETAYAQVSLVKEGSGYHSYAEPIVNRIVEDVKGNTVEVQAFSRPVPYPKDWDGWLVANTNDVTRQSDSKTVSDSDTTEVTYKTADEINAMSAKADLIAYGESIGMTGLNSNSSLAELRTAILNYQEEKQAGN